MASRSAWTTTPTQWDNNFFENLFGFEWELTRSPAGAQQWRPTDRAADDTRARRPRPGEAPRADDAHHGPGAAVRPGLRGDLPALPRGSRPSSPTPSPGPGSSSPTGTWGRCRGTSAPRSPTEELIWQDPVPAVDHALVDEQDVAALKATILASGPSVAQLVSTAWASASTFRDSDKRGGANGARIRLAPQKDWEANDPTELATVLAALEQVQADFNASATGGKRVSLADLIVLGGCAAVEQAAQRRGHDVQVPFVAGRTDATPEQTDVDAFAVMEPRADGFRNYSRAGEKRRPEELFVDRASLLGLTAPEMTVLVGGLRALGRQRRRGRARRPHRPARDT